VRHIGPENLVHSLMGERPNCQAAPGNRPQTPTMAEVTRLPRRPTEDDSFHESVRNGKARLTHFVVTRES
jgi:hypothetical protein